MENVIRLVMSGNIKTYHYLLEFKVQSAASGAYLRGYWKQLSLIIITAVLAAALLLYLYYKLQKTTIPDKLIKAIKKILGLAAGLIIDLIAKAYELLSLTTSRGLQQIKGYKDERIKIEYTKEEYKSKIRFKKWKKMDNRERIRYLYAKSIIRWIKAGFDFETYDTPKEIGVKLESQKRMKNEDQPLFDLYNQARYEQNSEIDDDMVNQMQGMTKSYFTLISRSK